MALRMVYEKTMNLVAGQYRTVLGNQLAQYGAFFWGWRGKLCRVWTVAATAMNNGSMMRYQQSRSFLARSTAMRALC